MPRKKRRPETEAVRHLAAAHGAADTKLIADTLRAAAGDLDDANPDRGDLLALAEEHDMANRDRHVYLRTTR